MKVWVCRLTDQFGKLGRLAMDWVELDNILNDLQAMEPGDSLQISVECKEMSKEEYDNLPEFKGW